MMSIQFPLIVVNFKAHESALGEAAIRLAKIHQEVAIETGAALALCVSALDVQAVSKAVSLPVFVQHVDPVAFGAYTGFLPPAAVKAAGAFGTLLNHAEHKLSDDVLAATILKCREVGLFTLVCAESIERALRIMTFHPDLIALEPPELIGGDISVSTAKPELISEAVNTVAASASGMAGAAEEAGMAGAAGAAGVGVRAGAVGAAGVGVRAGAASASGMASAAGAGLKLLVGAGVKNAADVRKSLELGAAGVLLASGVTKAKDPKTVLLDLVSGLKK